MISAGHGQTSGSLAIALRRRFVDDGGGELHHDDRQPARPGHDHVPPASFHLVHSHHVVMLLLAVPVLTAAGILLLFDRESQPDSSCPPDC